MNEDKNMDRLQEIIGYTFRDRELLREAMTHSSYAHERQINKNRCNERLEFLGDAVLEQVSSEFLFLRYPDMAEGEMSRFRASLVCEPALAECARKIHLGELIFLGKGESLCGGREKDSVTSDAFEALLGAMYLDGGAGPVGDFIREMVLKDPEYKRMTADPKSALQEYVQANDLGEILYTVIGESGPEHDKTFTVELKIDGKARSTGSGHNKKAAEKSAAYELLLKILGDRK